MFFSLSCTTCGARMTVAAFLAGYQVRCSDCRQVIEVPLDSAQQRAERVQSPPKRGTAIYHETV